MQWLAIAIGGALGAMARFAVSAYVFPVAAHRFPLATFSVNVLGSLAIGVLYVLIIEKGTLDPAWRNWLMSGFLGAFTTFSAFALDAVNLWQNGHGALALIYIVSSLICSILAVAAAIFLTLRLIG